jgi:NADH-quinone oxidoreductase subunit E
MEVAMLTDEIRNEIEAEARHYAPRSGASIDALRIVQRHRGWVDDESLREVAALLGMTPDELDSVATFYNLIFRRPVGRHVIRLCTSVSCWIMGSERIQERLKERLGIGLGETTPDGRFTLVPNQCLGTCDHAPAIMIDDDLHQDAGLEQLDAILAKYE